MKLEKNDFEMTLTALDVRTCDLLFEVYCKEIETDFSHIIKPSSIEETKTDSFCMFFNPNENEECLYLLELTNFYRIDGLGEDNVKWSIFRDREEAEKFGKQKFELICDIARIQNTAACIMNIIKINPFKIVLQRMISETFRYSIIFENEDNYDNYDYYESDVWMGEGFKDNISKFLTYMDKIFVHDKMVNHVTIVKSDTLRVDPKQTRGFALGCFVDSMHYSDSEEKEDDSEEDTIEINI